MGIFQFIHRRTVALASTVVLGLYMLLQSTSAHAVVVSYDLEYLDSHLFAGDTDFYATIFLDDSDYTGVGTENVTLLGVDMTFNGGWTGGVDASKYYDNLSTGPITFPSSASGNFVPFYAIYEDGNFTGSLRGKQPGGPSGLGVANLSFFFDSHGHTANLLFFGSALKRGNNTTDITHRTGISGPTTVSAVPVPAAIWLFGTALIGIVGFSKRRKA